MTKNVFFLSSFLLLAASASAQQRVASPGTTPAPKNTSIAPERSAATTPQAIPSGSSKSPAVQSSPAPPANVPLRPVAEQSPAPDASPKQTAQPAPPVRKKIGMVARPITTEPKMSK